MSHDPPQQDEGADKTAGHTMIWRDTYGHLLIKQTSGLPKNIRYWVIKIYFSMIIQIHMLTHTKVSGQTTIQCIIVFVVLRKSRVFHSQFKIKI